MKIDHIQFPYAYLSNGSRVLVKSIKGNVRVGASVNDELVVIGNNVNVDCINGVCPIK